MRSRRYVSVRIRLLALVGLLAGLFAVYVSFTANGGLPGASFYAITVEVPDANRMIRNNQVRIGGVRVGQVASVDAVGSDGRDGSPHARLGLKLDPKAGPLPADSTFTIRPASVLGATYVDVVPGRSERLVRDGGTFGLDRARETVDLTDLLDLFDPHTAKALQGTLDEVALGMVGRGTQLGAVVSTVSEAAKPLQVVARVIAGNGTQLDGVIESFDAMMGGLAAASDAVGVLLRSGAQTTTALEAERTAIDATIAAFPATARDTRRALARVRPGLEGLAELSRDLLPASRRLPAALRATSATFRAGVPAAEGLPRYASRLASLVRNADAFAKRPETDGSLRKIDDVLDAVGGLATVMAPAQQHCNTFSLWGQNFYEAFGTVGSGRGPSTGVAYIKALGSHPIELLQNREPHPNLHVNYLPKQNANECEAGNETFVPGRQVLDNPAGHQSTAHVKTYPPANVRDQARRAGLLDTPPGDR